MEWPSLCFMLATTTSSIDQTTPSLVEEENFKGSNKIMIAEDPTPQTPKKVKDELMEPRRHHREDETTSIRQRCPPMDTIFCDGLNSVVEMLSFDSDMEGETMVPTLEETPSSAGGGKPYLPPTADQGTPTCQRRGRFLVWPVGMSDPNFALPETMSARLE